MPFGSWPHLVTWGAREPYREKWRDFPSRTAWFPWPYHGEEHGASPPNQPSSKFSLRIWLVKPTVSAHRHAVTWQTLPFHRERLILLLYSLEGSSSLECREPSLWMWTYKARGRFCDGVDMPRGESTHDMGRDWTVNERSWRTRYLSRAGVTVTLISLYQKRRQWVDHFRALYAEF